MFSHTTSGLYDLVPFQVYYQPYSRKGELENRRAGLALGDSAGQRVSETWKPLETILTGFPLCSHKLSTMFGN